MQVTKVGFAYSAESIYAVDGPPLEDLSPNGTLLISQEPVPTAVVSPSAGAGGGNTDWADCLTYCGELRSEDLSPSQKTPTRSCDCCQARNRQGLAGNLVAT